MLWLFLAGRQQHSSPCCWIEPSGCTTANLERVRAGDRAAVYLLLGWGFYSVGVLAIVGLLSGLLPVNFWSVHGFQMASLVELGGGDEFVLVVPGMATEADARVLGEKPLRAFADPFHVADGSCRVGLTIGYALAPQDDLGLDGLLKRADAAMYAGKQAGKNRLQRGAAGAGLAAAHSTQAAAPPGR